MELIGEPLAVPWTVHNAYFGREKGIFQAEFHQYSDLLYGHGSLAMLLQVLL